MSFDDQTWAAIADGDNIGELLDTFAAANDLSGLIRTSNAIDADREALARWFEVNGATVGLSAADTVIASGKGEPPGLPLYPSFQPSWSIGIGEDLRRARAALAVAKALGRNRVVDGRDWKLT